MSTPKSVTNSSKKNRAPRELVIRSHRILWVNCIHAHWPEQQIAEFCEPYSLEIATSVEEAYQTLLDKDISVLVVEDGADQQAILFLEKAAKLSPHSVRILIVENLSYEKIKASCNFANVFRLMEFKSFSKQWPLVKKLSLQTNEVNLQSIEIRKKANQQLRELEKINQNLEKTVEERTLHIRYSKDEEEKKLLKVRQHTQFIRELSSCRNFEEIILAIRKEFRKYNKVGEAHLLISSPFQQAELLSVISGQVNRSIIQEPVSLPQVVTWNEPHMSQTLANYLERPLMKMIYIPLEVGRWKKLGLRPGQVTLCIENSFLESDISIFLDFALERLKPMSLVVDQMLIENELQIQSLRWEKTFDGIRDPLAIISADYRVLRSNKKFQVTAQNQRCYELFAGRNSPCESCPLQDSLKSQKGLLRRVRVRSQIFEVHSYPIHSESMEHSEYSVHQYVDVTKARELYLRMLQNEKMSAIGLLAGNIAHELNNPLSGLRSLTQVLLAQDNLEAELKSDLIEIEKATVRSQKIIRHLIEFSQGQGTQVVQTNWDDIVEKTLPLLRTMTRSHRMDLKLNSAAASIQVDPQLIQQVVFNLVNNACQAMTSSGQLSIETSVDASGKFSILRVGDNGPGISPENQDKIFQPFFTTKHEGQGTGLGLSLAKDIVEKFGGRIYFQTTLGQGTQFFVEFPCIMGEL